MDHNEVTGPAGQFGTLPPGSFAAAPTGTQYSPVRPGSARLEDVAPDSLAGFTMQAMAGTIERRRDVALMLRALRPGAPFLVFAGKQNGGLRLAAELRAFGCAVEESAKSHQRLCAGHKPTAAGQGDGDQAALASAISEGAPQFLADLGLWSQPGVFSWNKIDGGTALLLDSLPRFSGRGADLGCGIGVLAHAVLPGANVTALHMIDIDRRAIDVARRNVVDARAAFQWADLRTITLDGLDFVVSNVPFHENGRENRDLGDIFIERAAASLKRGGQFWMVANRHLPYERALTKQFRDVAQVAGREGFKVLVGTR